MKRKFRPFFVFCNDSTGFFMLSFIARALSDCFFFRGLNLLIESSFLVSKYLLS